MSSQSTIFMTLEHPSPIIRIPHLLSSTSTTTSTIYCDYCKKQIPDHGKFFIIDNQIRFFDTYYCKKYFIKRNEGQKKKVKRKIERTLQCIVCKKEFDPKSKIYKRKCCSMECRTEHQRNVNQRYNKYFWCDCCTSWIPKETAIWKQYKTIRRALCPKMGCNNNKLKTRSTNYNSKKRRLERIRNQQNQQNATTNNNNNNTNTNTNTTC